MNKKYKYHLLDNDLVKEFEDGEIYTVVSQVDMITRTRYLNGVDSLVKNSVDICKLEELIERLSQTAEGEALESIPTYALEDLMTDAKNN